MGRVALTEQVTCEQRLALSENESLGYLEEEASRQRGQPVREPLGWKHSVCWRNSKRPEPGTQEAGVTVLGAEVREDNGGTTWALVAGGKDFGSYSASSREPFVQRRDTIRHVLIGSPWVLCGKGGGYVG